MKICALVPMKDPKNAKTRLGNALPLPARMGLARTLFRNVLSTAAQARSFSGMMVVTGSNEIASIANTAGADVVRETENGLNAAVALGADKAKRKGFDAICVLPGDLAEPSVDDLIALNQLAGPRSVVLAPSHDGGTNALVVPVSERFQFSYGPASSQSHQRAAYESGLSCIVSVKESFLHDVDTMDDLERYAKLSAGQWLQGFVS